MFANTMKKDRRPAVYQIDLIDIETCRPTLRRLIEKEGIELRRIGCVSKFPNADLFMHKPNNFQYEISRADPMRARMISIFYSEPARKSLGILRTLKQKIGARGWMLEEGGVEVKKLPKRPKSAKVSLSTLSADGPVKKAG